MKYRIKVSAINEANKLMIRRYNNKSLESCLEILNNMMKKGTLECVIIKPADEERDWHERKDLDVESYNYNVIMWSELYARGEISKRTLNNELKSLKKRLITDENKENEDE